MLCIDKSDWEDELNDIIKQKFLKFLNDLKNIKQISMSRFIYEIFKEQICNTELHCFCNSLLQAYSSVVYIRVITNLGVKNNLIYSKTKLSPMKEFTIPRLELISCVLLTKLLQSVLKRLSLNTASINWIKNNKEWKICVQNRIDIINKVVKADNWHYISSSDNPADIATRDCAPNSIVNNKLWWSGPEFLLRNKESWPEDKFVSDATDELRIAAKSNVAVNVEFIDQTKQKMCAIININKYGSLTEVLNISFYVLKFLNIIYEKTFKKSFIKVDNIFDCELLWLKRYSMQWHYLR